MLLPLLQQTHTQVDGQQPMPVPLQVLKPNELFYSKIIPLLKENGLSEQTPRKEWPHHVQLRVLKELMAETPSDLLAKSVQCGLVFGKRVGVRSLSLSPPTQGAVVCLLLCLRVVVSHTDLLPLHSSHVHDRLHHRPWRPSPRQPTCQVCHWTGTAQHLKVL